MAYPGANYHLTNRMIGNWKEQGNRLFRDAGDYIQFLDQLAGRVRDFEIRVYLFCLMVNHYHLVVETPQGNIASFMQSLSTAYAVYYNHRYRRHGHLLDGRYKARLVEGDVYLLALSRYVHLNPVCVAGWQKRPLEEQLEHLRSYQWSSYLEYVGRGRKREWVDYAPILAQMGSRQVAPRYRQYVESGLAEEDDAFRRVMRASALSIGTEGFRDWVDGEHQELLEGHRRREDVAFRRMVLPLDAEWVLGRLAASLGVEIEAFRRRRRDSPLRALATKDLTQYGGQTQRQVADLLGMGTGVAVCNQLRKLPGLLSQNGKLRRQVAAMDREMESEQRRRASGSQPRARARGA